MIQDLLDIVDRDGNIVHPAKSWHLLSRGRKEEEPEIPKSNAKEKHKEMTHRKQKAGEDDGAIHSHKVTTDKGKQRARKEDDQGNIDAYGEWVAKEEAGMVSNMQFRYSKLTDSIVRSI